MVRKIKSLNEMPSWFDLANFDYLKSLGAKDWASVITYLRWRGEDDFISYLQGPDCDFSIDEVFAQPLLPEEEEEDDAIRNRILQYRYGTDPAKFMFRGVAALTNSVVSYLADEIRSIPEAAFLQGKRVARGGKKRGKPFHLTPEQESYAGRPFFLTLQEVITVRGDPEPLTCNRAISVNMSLPDDMLVDDFRDWLKASRSLSFHKAAPKVFTKNDFAKWCDYRLVPYSILTYWAKAIDAEITHSAMAAALFPNSRMIGPDHIRKTIKPAWEAWLCPETVDALHAQAAKID